MVEHGSATIYHDRGGVDEGSFVACKEHGRHHDLLGRPAFAQNPPARCGDRNLALNATHAAYPLYVSLGFTSEAIVYMRQGEVPQTLPPMPALDGELSELPGDRLSELTALDARAFGTNRARLIALLSEDASISTLSRAGEVVGYSMCREFGRGHVIGPTVARSDQDAVHLTAVHLKKLGDRFARVDSRERDGVFAEFLQQSDLGIAETVTTMSKGPPVPEPGK